MEKEERQGGALTTEMKRLLPSETRRRLYELSESLSKPAIAAEKENASLASLITPAYAAGEIKVPVVKGNYKMDPSLPSLLPVKGTVTSSGIFDPSVCFITD